jgi:quercetin dioxygenase-like cupin family protein
MRVEHLRAKERVFTPFQQGTQIALLRRHPGGGATTLTQFVQGVRGAFHTHPGGEEVYVVRGRARIGDVEVEEGDYLYTPAGLGHAVEAYEDTLLLVVLPLAPDYSNAVEIPGD